jgi:hypothetical protein
MKREMKALVELLVSQQVRIFELVDLPERPILRPPVGTATLKGDSWIQMGLDRATSYQRFLLICDGIENFCLSYGLLGAQDLLAESYPQLLRVVLDEGAGFDYEEQYPPILVGYDKETTTRVFLDLSHEPLQKGELVVLEGDPGDMSLHQSFETFLESRVEANEHTISHLLDLRAGRTEE